MKAIFIVLVTLAAMCSAAMAQTETQTFDNEGGAAAAGWLANEVAQDPVRNIDLGYNRVFRGGYRVFRGAYRMFRGG